MNKKTCVSLGLVACALVLAVGIFARDRREVPRPCNILLITLDTTRADRLGCYGYAAAETPALDRLAAEGVLFENAYCTVPLTLPSHTSILTGLLPPEHGVRRNGAGALSVGIPVLNDMLYTHDYQTAAFLAVHILGAKYGLDRGFDVYDAPIPPAAPTPGHGDHRRYRLGAEVADAAIQWMRSVDSEHFFCWVHLFDPHVPYNAHEDLFGDRYLDRPYDAEIAYADRQIARLIECLDEQGVRDDTLIIVAGDHGESLDDHDEPYPYHGFLLYNSTVRVPLIMAQRGRIEAGRRTPQTVSLVDVYPTIANWMRMRQPTKTSGRALTPALLGGSIETVPAYTETLVPESYGCRALQAMIADDWKYIRNAQPELYNLRDDPGERHDLALQQLDLRDQMEARLGAIEDGMAERQAAESVAMSDADRRRLESLGYAGADAVTTPGVEDIRTMLPTITMSHEATELQQAGKYDESIALWQQVTGQCASCTMFHNSLGTALLADGQVKQAVNIFSNLVAEMRADGRSDPEQPEDMSGLYVYVVNNLAYGLGKLGRYAEAMPLIREALELSPSMAQVHHTLATLYRGTGQLAQAETAITIALRLDPAGPDNILLAAELRVDAKAFEAAGEFLRRLDVEDLDSRRRERLAGLRARLSAAAAETSEPSG